MAEQAPDFLTVTETAKVLRIRRTAAYQLVNHDLETGGADGLRARRFGRQIRVPRAALEQLTGAPLAWPAGEPVAELDAHRERRATPGSSSSSKRRSSRNQTRDDSNHDVTQRPLPFTG